MDASPQQPSTVGGARRRIPWRWAVIGGLFLLLAAVGAAEGPRAVDRYLQAVRHKQAIRPGELPPAIADLPVVLARPAGPPKALVLFLSGDGGWQIIDRKITGPLARAGYLMAGIDSVAYFDRRRTPHRLAADMTRIIRALRPNDRTPVVLMGFSFGADVLPFIATRLPPDLKAALAQTVFLGLSPRADFWLDLGALVRWTGIAERPTEPEIETMGAMAKTCVYGDKEKNTLCPLLKVPNLTAVKLPGDHHFDENYPVVIATLRDILDRTAQQPLPSAPSPVIPDSR